MASSACRARPLEACNYSFRMESCGMESLDLEKSRVAREKLFGLGPGRLMGGDSEPWRLGCLGGGARNDSHQVVCRFFMCRFAGTQPGGSGLEKSRVAREKLFGLGQGHRIGGGFAPGLGAGLPWRRCKMQSKAKDGRTLHQF